MIFIPFVIVTVLKIWRYNKWQNYCCMVYRWRIVCSSANVSLLRNYGVLNNSLFDDRKLACTSQRCNRRGTCSAHLTVITWHTVAASMLAQVPRYHQVRIYLRGGPCAEYFLSVIRRFFTALEHSLCSHEVWLPVHTESEPGSHHRSWLALTGEVFPPIQRAQLGHRNWCHPRTELNQNSDVVV